MTRSSSRSRAAPATRAAAGRSSSLANQHLRVSKVSDGKSTRTNVQTLGKDERIEELARMLGGVEITRKTLAHAAEMLAAAPKKRA